MVGTWKAMPVRFPRSEVMLLVSDFMTRVGEGMRLPEAEWSPCQSLRKGKSPTALVAVMDLTVVLRACYMSISTSLGGVRVYDRLGATLYYGLGRLLGEENTSRLTNTVRSKGTPL